MKRVGVWTCQRMGVRTRSERWTYWTYGTYAGPIYKSYRSHSGHA